MMASFGIGRIIGSASIIVALIFLLFGPVQPRSAGRGGGARGGSSSRSSSSRSSSYSSYRSSSYSSYSGYSSSYASIRYSRSYVGWSSAYTYYYYYNLYFYRPYTYGYYGTRTYNSEATGSVCKNYEANDNGTALGVFVCPMPWEPSSFTYCCGESEVQYCCELKDSAFFSGIIFGVIAGCALLILIILCSIKCSKRKKTKTGSRVEFHTHNEVVQIRNAENIAPGAVSGTDWLNNPLAQAYNSPGWINNSPAAPESQPPPYPTAAGSSPYYPVDSRGNPVMEVGPGYPPGYPPVSPATVYM